MIPANPKENIQVLTPPEAGWDNAALAGLLSLIEDRPLTAEEVAGRLALLENIETPLLAYIAGKAVGFACLRVVPCLSAELPCAELTEFYVEQAYRGGDVERHLLRRAERLSVQGGAGQLVLLTGLRNTNAQALYRALGYRDFALALRKQLVSISPDF